MHRDKALYGDDAQSFRPERWFEKDAEKLAAMTRTNDLIFGDGKWQCLGKPVAMMELPKIIFEEHAFLLSGSHAICQCFYCKADLSKRSVSFVLWWVNCC